MGRITRFLALTSLMSLFAGLAFADDLARSFEEAAARGDAQQHADSTVGYFAKILLPYYGHKYAPVLQSCFAKVPKPDTGRFSFVAAIGSDGRVERLYQDRETNIFLCLRGTLEKDVFPRPPESPYYLHIEMSFAAEDEPEEAAEEAAEEAPPLVLEPDRYSYTFGVPKGWEYSFEQAKELGVRLVFFPRGGSFDESNSVIYVNEADASCTPSCEGTVARAIEHEIQESRNNSPGLRVATERSIKIKGGGEAHVRIFTGARDPRQAKEALAFIEHNDVIVLVVLTTMDTKTWDQDYAAFQEVVSGHRFFPCDSVGLAVPCRR